MGLLIKETGHLFGKVVNSEYDVTSKMFQTHNTIKLATDSET
jgi:hypothetical protein